MKKEKIDDLIEKALSADEAEFYRSLDEQNMFQMVSGLFKGKFGFINGMASLMGLVAFGFAIYFGIQFYQSNDILEAIKLGASSIVLLMMQTAIKMYNWMQMDKNALIREIKRLELQIAILNSKLKGKGQEND